MSEAGDFALQGKHDLALGRGPIFLDYASYCKPQVCVWDQWFTIVCRHGIASAQFCLFALSQRCAVSHNASCKSQS